MAHKIFKETNKSVKFEGLNEVAALKRRRRFSLTNVVCDGIRESKEAIKDIERLKVEIAELKQRRH